ncbi:MAG: BatA domain-containing protein [Rhizomicrobium sp.]
MAGLLAGLSFGAPFILGALIVLPAVWWLLRVTPPLPRRLVFPPLRLLLGLSGKEETPARTPWWLLLLRLIAAAAVIVALAEPLFGKGPTIAGTGPVVLVVDNGWTSAANWDARQAVIADVLRSATQQRRAVAIVPTADIPDVSLMDAGRAARIAQALTPQPWLPDRRRAAAAIAKAKFDARPEILWLSDGIEDGAAGATADTLAKAGALTIYADAPGQGALALLPPANKANGFDVSVLRADTDGARGGRVQALGSHGEMLAEGAFRFADGRAKADAHISLPLEVRNETTRIAIANADAAGAVQLLGGGGSRRAVGLVAADVAEDTQPLLSDTYYLERALAPYAEVRKGTIGDVLARNVSVLILADVARVTGSDYDKVAKFVAGGGLLIRFAGGRMTGGTDDLVPVKLRVGGRYLGGALAWAEPQKLAPFADSSPFAGLAIPSDVSVTRQVLAEPSVELADRSWARLADGTPLVTAENRGKGFIVLFHITAGPSWSSLPLSGLYVDMMRRLLALSVGAKASDMKSATTLPPVTTLDGFGRARKPPAEVLPIRAIDLAKTVPSPVHPPGLYGVAGTEDALNAVKADAVLLPFAGIDTEPYPQSTVTALAPWFLSVAIALLFLDALLSLGMRGYLSRLRLTRIAAVALALLFAVRGHGARADDAFDLKAADDTRLAYVVTGLADVDEMSRAGLTGLALQLLARTSYEPQDPMGVDVAKDDLSFFPLLYWPMDRARRTFRPRRCRRSATICATAGRSCSTPAT